MANTITFTNLAPMMYRAMDRVAREQVGAMYGVMINTSGADLAAQGDKVQSLRTSAAIDKASYTPAMTPPAAGDKTNVMDEFAINQYVGKELPLTGETTKRLQNVGLYGEWIEGEFAQIFRAISNTIEAYLCATIKKGASRGYGTPGTNPFATNINALAQLSKILKDNGAPMEGGELSLVMDTTAGAALQSLTQLQKVNEAGDGGALLRQGTLGTLNKFFLRESAGIATHTKGTATGFDATAAFAIGDSTITVDGSNSGTILAGDLINWVGDANIYVAKSATASGAATGNIVLNRPGLRATLADTVEGSISNSYTPNVGFHKSAVELAMRAPAQPEGGDLAVDVMRMRDPFTKAVYEFRLYKGYGMNKIEVNVFYDAIVWKPEFVATLIG